MSRNEQDLLLRIRGDSKDAVKAVSDTRAAIGQLRSSGGNDLKALQATSTQSLGSVTNSLSQITANIPGIGRAFAGLSSNLSLVAAEGATAGTSIAALAGPAALAVVAVVGLTTAVIKLHQWLFDLAVQAATFRGKLFDLSQQTGVSVETLSALEIVAKTTGSSIEQISASLGIFQRHLEDAQDPTTKQAKLFAELGVATDDTEQALRDTLAALAAMPEGFKQTATALELFGRGGKSMLAILKETNGDLDGAIERFRELGIIVSQEDARAADEFNDQLALLQFQFRGLLGKEVLPAALGALQDFSRFLKDNKQQIDTVSSAIGTLATVLSTRLKVELAIASGVIRDTNTALEVQAGFFERIARSVGLISANIPKALLLSPEGGARGINFRPQDVGGGETDTRIHQAITQKEIEQAAALKKAQDELRSALEKQANAWKSLVGELKTAQDSYEGIDTATREYTVRLQIANGVFGDAESALAKNALAAAKTTDEYIRKKKAIDELTQFQERLNKAVDEAINGEQSLFDITEEAIKKYEEAGDILSLTEEHWLRQKTAIVAVVAALKMYNETLEAIQVGGRAIDGIGEGAISQAAGTAANARLGLPPEAEKEIKTLDDALLKLGQTLAGTFGAGAEFAEGFADIAGGAINSLASGVAGLVESWVLLGTTGPAAMRKLVASVLAGVAAQAAVKAIFQLAEGFAALFFSPAEAAAHFTAAALFGSIAGVAAVAGRAIAGDAFRQPEREKSGSRGSGGSGSSSSGSSRPATVEVDRNRYQPIDREITVRIRGVDVVDSFIEDFDLNGRTRLKILGET